MHFDIDKTNNQIIILCKHQKLLNRKMNKTLSHFQNHIEEKVIFHNHTTHRSRANTLEQNGKGLSLI